ncbi:uncharacterized protein LOC106641837 [Copidosoma floridanum]|uniref:uncharacterized protein LOC106641837 n=1 Tax=Copidosoma floridanum TaxID=29053 RepID=UPI0006C94D26|nr:uncharacterized protein LOC106641837 [Copidosoma floridanum]XP_014211862.1 uncharacterized protein LOC106641837 [Copidosoma floridanum]
MSWFFGKKKNKESPPSSPEEPAPHDGFIFVEKRNQPNTDNNTPSLYPNLNDPLSYQPMSGPVVKQNSQDGQNNDLTSIPFKFSKDLEDTLNQDLVIDKLRLEEILSFINKVGTENYDYEFQVERSVINEINSQNDE